MINGLTPAFGGRVSLYFRASVLVWAPKSYSVGSLPFGGEVSNDPHRPQPAVAMYNTGDGFGVKTNAV